MSDSSADPPQQKKLKLDRAGNNDIGSWASGKILLKQRKEHIA